MSSAAKRPRTQFTLQTKYAALKEIDSGVPRKDVIKKYVVSKNTLSDWVKKKESIYQSIENAETSSSLKKARKSCWDKVDDVLFQWFVKARQNGLAISGSILLEKANQFGSQLYDDKCTISPSWIDRWKTR